MSKSYQINMTEGNILLKIIKFSIPLMLSGMLQLFFNAADVIVVGRYAGDEALAAVGSTGALINLLINLFIGISIGASVLMGQAIGARDYNDAQDSLHTAMLTGLIGGIIMIFVGQVVSRPMLELMQTPDDVIELSSLYMKIYFMGMPGFMLYNFGAAILRAAGDTKRPLYYLFVSGIINVILNLYFVIVLKMSVDGVAYATIISEAISAILIVICLMRSDGYLNLSLRKLKIDGKKFIEMLKIGIPSGFTGIVFSVSNMLIQSSINSFGKLVMAANTAASNLEGFVYNAMNSIYQTALAFASQNMGAKKLDRVDDVLKKSLLVVSGVGLFFGVGAYLLGEILLRLYTPNQEVIDIAMLRLLVISTSYFLCGIMDVYSGVIRGMGFSFTPMLVSMFFVCAFRVFWIYTIFERFHEQWVLYISYPVSWTITIIAYFFTYKIVRKKAKEKILKMS
ncbi:MATE family efflux transporter [Fenollaria massiliensis]|uniref:MATE family efflux transporter n=1 Tax=Fenollaria massiliensis TaxID=938288 RepID=UPI000370D24F|nr:MATE family efflux transporter [Fenollaria massiliensis]